MAFLQHSHDVDWNDLDIFIGQLLGNVNSFLVRRGLLLIDHVDVL
jgi:hypothetical protein